MIGQIEGPSDLTPLQRKYLGNIWEYCQSAPTLGQMFGKSFPQYAILLSLNGLLLYLCLSYERYEAAWFVCGMLVGALARDLGMFRRAIQLWPATAGIIDRQRLAALIDKPQRGSEPDNWS
jgi:hypothetical protein